MLVTIAKQFYCGNKTCSFIALIKLYLVCVDPLVTLMSMLSIIAHVPYYHPFLLEALPSIILGLRNGNNRLLVMSCQCSMNMLKPCKTLWNETISIWHSTSLLSAELGAKSSVTASRSLCHFKKMVMNFINFLDTKLRMTKLWDSGQIS